MRPATEEGWEGDERGSYRRQDAETKRHTEPKCCSAPTEAKGEGRRRAADCGELRTLRPLQPMAAARTDEDTEMLATRLDSECQLQQQQQRQQLHSLLISALPSSLH